MSTMCMEQPNFRPVSNGSLRPDLQKVVAGILALRAITKKSGFRTTRGQNEILGKLNGPDLAAVACVLAEVELSETK
jgi:hypothetical protein